MYDLIVHKWLRVPHVLHVGIDKGPKRPLQTVVFIHGIANSHAMWKDVIATIDTTKTRVIAVDLLGFGESPKPLWQLYRAVVHARSLRMTLLRRKVRGPIILVGHSLGSLVAIQYAARYPRNLESLLLCSPPFYKPSQLASGARVGKILQPDDAYHMLYRHSRHKKELAVRLAKFLKSAKLLSKHFTVDEATMPAIVSSLEMSIENQTSLEDAKQLTIPVHVLHGQFDAFVLKRHLKSLQQHNPNAHIYTLPAGHELSGLVYQKAVIKHIHFLLEKSSENKHSTS